MKGKATYLISTAVLAAALVSPTAGAGHGRFGLAGRTTLLAGAPRHLAEASWSGGTYSIPDGGQVAIYISTSYTEPGSLAQHWVGFFAGLPHGKEISALKVYVAPIAEVNAVERVGMASCKRSVEAINESRSVGFAAVRTAEFTPARAWATALFNSVARRI